MSLLDRAAEWVANLLTWGLPKRMDRDIAIEAENLKRLHRGERRLDVTISKDLSETLSAEPFWRRGEKGQ